MEDEGAKAGAVDEEAGARVARTTQRQTEDRRRGTGSSAAGSGVARTTQRQTEERKQERKAEDEQEDQALLDV